MPTIAGANLTKRAHDAIVTAALEEAENRGYCEEVEDILVTLGFDLPENDGVFLVKVKVNGLGARQRDLDLGDFRIDVFSGDAYVDYIQSVERV